MSKIRLLIVDDSIIVQEVLKDILSTDAEIEVVGIANNGREGIEKVQELSPDFVTMDLNMPVMNGLEAIYEIMDEQPTPILVVSSINDSKIGFDACAYGAMDIYPKEDINPENATRLIKKIKALAKIEAVEKVESHHSSASTISESGSDRVVVIASSTGGPKALAGLLPEIPLSFPYPILIAQHLEEVFLTGFISWLSKHANQEIECGKGGLRIQSQKIYLSPSNKHMEVDPTGEIVLFDHSPLDKYTPSCNRLLSSVANSYGSKSIGIILSGTGDDGVEGISKIKNDGGFTIAQDEATSVAFGMNMLAISKNVIDKTLPIQGIGQFLATL